jgi:hypothetical protein
MMPARPDSVTLGPGSQAKLARELFNYVWTLLETEDRSEQETDRMIDAAHASRFFWEQVGQPVNHARGEWQLSRVYAVAGRGEEALRHAERGLELCQEHGIRDFDLAFAWEAMARAEAVRGDSGAAARHLERARAAAEQVAEREDRELVIGDLETVRL